MSNRSRPPRLIQPKELLTAYAYGVFPMARSAQDPDIHWIDPEHRGVIPLDSLHVPQRLARTLRKDQYEIKPDVDFRQVIMACAAANKGRASTWINAAIRESYCALHRIGHAHSIEVWRGETLVGGLYGVRLGAAFFGESMFSRERDVSKMALVHLVARLRRGGFKLLDTQFVTAHLEQFGAVELPRARYHALLRSALESEGRFYELGPAGAAVSGRVVLQETTQTS